MINVFMSYNHADENMRDRLELHLAMLKREGIIDAWHDRRIVAGHNVDATIMAEVESADIFLFLLSADFLASSYCYDIEMKRALERHSAGEAEILPVVLHSCDWVHTPLANFLAFPRDGKPIAKHAYQDDAYLEVATAIRAAVKARGQTNRRRETKVVVRPSEMLSSGHLPSVRPTSSRSSNLAIRKTFTDADNRRFLEDGFEFIGRYFEESLAELASRNRDVEVRFRQNSADAFTVHAFRRGVQEAQCRVQLGGGMLSHDGITFSHDPSMSSTSFNEMLSVRADTQGLMFDAIGMSIMGGREAKGLSMQGAAEFLWELFLRPMQA